jgi:N-acetylglucosamine-6-phosphate deacetylase
LGNGCANLIHRAHNPFWPQLADDRLHISIITDGFHLTDAEIQTFFKVKGVDHVILTSDITELAGLPPGKYDWHDAQVVLTPEGVIKYPAQDVLVGASFPLLRGVENMMRFTGCSLADAIHMASTNPARLYDLGDRGEIKIGKRADMILFLFKNGKITIKQTMIAGKVVFNN